MCEWHPENKEWLKARKEQWKPIKKNLQKWDLVRRDDIKLCENYFLTGERVDVAYGVVPEICQLWFHPDHSEENWLRILENKRGWKDFIEARSQMWHSTLR